MRITGEYDTDGNYQPYAKGYEKNVVQVGDTLRDTFDGMVEAIKDDYGDWVNPRMLRLGLKVRCQVEE